MSSYIEEQWRDFEVQVVSDQAGKDQRFDMRAAFYGGALVMFKLFEHAADLEESEGAAVLKDLCDEFSSFMNEVEARYADENPHGL